MTHRLHWLLMCEWMQQVDKIKKTKMMYSKEKFRSGLTLYELIVTMVIAPIIILAVSVLLIGGQRSWQQTYNSAHKEIKLQAQDVMITFGSIARRSNRLNYIIYEIDGSTFIPLEPESATSEGVVSGDAVEFRYWDVELDEGDPHNLLDVTKTATAYALFYLDSSQLKVDRGPYPPGGVPEGGGSRNITNVSTTILAENVTTDENIGAFSHTIDAGKGQGCVRINVTLTDPNDGETIKVMTAALTRNIWPR